MLGEDIALYLSAHYFKRVGNRGADHPRNDTCDEIINAEGLSLLIKGIVESSKSPFFVAGRKSSLEKPFKSFMLINFHHVVDQTSAPPLVTSVFIPGFQDREGIGSNGAKYSCVGGAEEGNKH